MGWTEEDVKKHMNRAAGGFQELVDGTPIPKIVPRLPGPIEYTDRFKNKWERDYASYLDQLLFLKEIVWWGYECWGFRLADNTFHYPDFPIVYSDHIKIIDVKGHKRQTWLVKVKTCKELYPFIRWGYTKKVKGQWEVTYI